MGKIFKFDSDVDTDQIIASQYLLYPTIDEMKLEGADVLADARKLFERVNVGLPKDKQLVLC